MATNEHTPTPDTEADGTEVDTEGSTGPIQARPITVRFSKDPRPSLVLVDGDQELDVTHAVEGFELHVSVEAGAVTNAVVLHMRADTEQVEWDSGEVLVAGQTKLEVTPEEIDQLLAYKGWAQSGGEAVVAHLIERGVIDPS